VLGKSLIFEQKILNCLRLQLGRLLFKCFILILTNHLITWSVSALLNQALKTLSTEVQSSVSQVARPKFPFKTDFQTLRTFGDFFDI